MICKKCCRAVSFMCEGFCFTCWLKSQGLPPMLSKDEKRIAELEAELAEAKAFAERLSDELDKANATINRLDNKILQQNKELGGLREDAARIQGWKVS